MRILFLDDMKTRHSRVRFSFPEHEITHVWTSKEAIETLTQQPPFDVAMLDHDLAEEHYEADVVYGEGTGMDVVDHIIQMPVEKRPVRVVVHTFNERGREMRARLRDAGVDVEWIRFGRQVAER